jgi:hypothetical protein
VAGKGVPRKKEGDATESVPSEPSSPGLVKRKKKATALSPERMDPLWKMLNEKMGGRDGLLAAAIASQNPKAKDLAALILDSAHKTWGTKALAKKAGLTAPEIVDMFRDRKWLEATLALHDELPDIVRDAATDAKASYIPCDACRGKGVNWEKGEGGEECYVCQGKRVIRKPGDKDKLKFVGEAAGMVGKAEPQTQVNVQVNNQTQTASVSFEDLLRKATIAVNKPKEIEAPIVVETE